MMSKIRSKKRKKRKGKRGRKKNNETSLLETLQKDKERGYCYNRSIRVLYILQKTLDLKCIEQWRQRFPDVLQDAPAFSKSGIGYRHTSQSSTFYYDPVLSKMTNMYSKILVPYDISMPADKALEHAVKLAEAMHGGAEIILLHVVAELPLYPLIGIKESSEDPRHAPLVEHIEKVHDEAKGYIAQMMEERKNRYLSQGITLKIEVLKGTPVEEIIEYAEKEKIDLIVLGNVGWGEISKSKTLGSVARGVVEGARCPVTVVH